MRAADEDLVGMFSSLWPHFDERDRRLMAAACACAGASPVVSVDTKKKELIGNYKNSGTEWRQAKSPRPVNTYDFIDKQLGEAIP